MSTMHTPKLEPLGTQVRFRASLSEGLQWWKKQSRPWRAGGPRELVRCPLVTLGILGTLDPQVSRQYRDKASNDAT